MAARRHSGGPFGAYLVGIKGPLTTPVGGGIRSLNVALRQILDLYVCLRPVRYFSGVPSPVRQPELVDMVIFRENTEDIYAGIEFEQGTDDNARFKDLLAEHFADRYGKIRFPDTAGLGVKPISQEGTERLVRAAIDYAADQGRDSVTLVHKGNIMKFTEGAFRDWGYELAQKAYGGEEIDGGPWTSIVVNGTEITVKDAIADAFLQQILTRPAEYSVIATMNLNGDYISDALAACVGGIGIAPGGNINYTTGHAIFEATHGTAPKYARPRQGQPRFGDPVGRHDAPPLGLERGRRLDCQGAGADDCESGRHVRLCAADGRADRGQVLGVWRGNYREYVVADELTHLDEQGRLKMVDVGGKEPTARLARVHGEIRMDRATARLIAENKVAKGNVLEAARLAGIMAAKRTGELIPLCHPLNLTAVRVDLHVGEDRVEVEAEAKIDDRTGVEMEALVAASTALLTIYDMCKGVDRGMVISELRLMEKRGGQSGTWVREEG